MNANFAVAGGLPPTARHARHRGDVDLDLLSEPTPATYSSEDFQSDGDTVPSVLQWLAPEPELMQALVIDPDRESRFYLRAKLALADFLLTDDAATAGEALYLLKTRRYQLVIMDLDLPDIEGWQLAAKVGAAGGRPALADSMILTRHKLSWLDELRARRVGAIHCLRKPLHPVELGQMLRTLR
jgi:CheY-like chemotaxis protein